MSAITDFRSQAFVPSGPASASPTKRWRNLKAELGKLRLGNSGLDHESSHMFNLYRTNLEVRLRTIDETSLLSDSQKKIYATVVDMLKAPAKTSSARNPEWNEIYKAESLIGMLYNGARLDQEIKARLQELAAESPDEAESQRRDYDRLSKPAIEDRGRGPDTTVLHAFLLRLLEAIHWNAKSKHLARPIRIQATNRILLAMSISFILLVAPYAYLVLDYGDDGVSRVWTLFALWTALTAGLLGAFFSRLMTIQRQWAKMSIDDMFLHADWQYTLLRAGVGVCGALIVYFFLRSGMAAGALFPNFGEVRIDFVQVPDGQGAVPMTFVMPSTSLALLTFWCFLAGFSEGLVPNVLAGAERQLTDAASPAAASRKR